MSRKRFVYRPKHPKASPNGFVNVDDLGSYSDGEAQAKHSPILVDRYMEGTKALDGTDIGSRTKRRNYMKQHNLADADDFKGEWANAENQREKFRRGEHDFKEVREQVARALHHQMNGGKR